MNFEDLDFVPHYNDLIIGFVIIEIGNEYHLFIILDFVIIQWSKSDFCIEEIGIQRVILSLLEYKQHK